MIINNLDNYQTILAQLFTDYLIRFGHTKKQEIDTYRGLSVQGSRKFIWGERKTRKENWRSE
jgi:hypothetical protein